MFCFQARHATYLNVASHYIVDLQKNISAVKCSPYSTAVNVNLITGEIRNNSTFLIVLIDKVRDSFSRLF